MLEGEQQDKGADADAASTRGNGGGSRQERRIVPILGEVVFGQPHLVIAQFLGAHDLIEERAVQLRVWPPPRLRVTKILHEAKLHCVSLPLLVVLTLLILLANVLFITAPFPNPPA